MVKPLTLGSLFDGIDGFCLAGQYAGMKPIWASEIEPFPIRVTEKRFPSVRQLGDVNSLSGEDIPPVDVITFGSPCQNLSIAGKRAGLQGTQSSLFFQAIRIITEMRCKTHGQYPSYAVWENVPGALSSNDGQDFRQVLESLAQIADEHTAVPMPENGKWLGAGEILGDHYSLAWRILDASKGWGVAQRRRRIFLVADFAGTGAGEILFESEGLSGYTPPCGEAWQGTARGAEGGTGASGTVVLNDQGGNRMDITENETSTLRAKMNSHQPVILASGFCTEHSADSRGIGYVEEESPTLRAGVTPGVAIEFNPTDNRIKVKENGICQTLCSRMGTGGNNVPLTLKIRSGCEGGGKGPLVQENQSATLSTRNDQTLFQPKVYGISSDQSHAMLSDNPHSGIYEADTSRTLDCKGGNPSCNQGGIAVVEAYALQGSMIGRKDENGPQGDGINKDVSFTLNTIDRHAVYAMNVGFFAAQEEQTPSLMARDWKDPPVVNTDKGEFPVRRLTPDECCRLQGYPDGWCHDLGDENPTPDEIALWRQRFAVWDNIQGRTRPRTDKEIIKWLQHPNSDAAEYKAYGNSVAVPCVFFVLAGIVWAAGKEIE